MRLHLTGFMRGLKWRKLEVSLHAERFVCGQIKRWSAVISLPLRHLAYVVVSSVSKLFAACKNILSEAYVVKNTIAMAPNIKGLALSTWAINDDVSLHAPDKYWYVAVFVKDVQVRSSRKIQLCEFPR